MTAIAQAALGLGEHESVRLVALGAAEPSVKLIVRVGGLVAAAASSRGFAAVSARRVRVVAADTVACWPQVGVIRMHRRMAVHTSLLRASSNVMGRVTAVALVVSRHAGRRQHRNLGVAGTAGSCRVLLELVRPMAAHALAVSAGKECALRHDGELSSMTNLAAAPSLGCRRVLVLMTRDAHELGRFSERRVAGGNVTVALRTRPRLGRGVLVRSVAIQALARTVNYDRWRGPLAGGVATRAIGRRKFVR